LTPVLRPVRVDPPLVEAAARGAPPEMRWVLLSQLVIDDSYQRPLLDANWRRIRAIAEGFTWSRFSPLVVAPVPDGRFAVVDGQHRAHAALLCGLTAVPAMVLAIEEGAQAEAFVGINTVTLRVTRQAMFKAALASGEAWAVEVDRVVTAAGCRMATYAPASKDKRPGVLYSDHLLRKLCGAGHGYRVTIALAAMRTYDTTGRVPLWGDYILRPWLSAFATPIFAPGHVTQARLLAVLERRDPFKVVEAGTLEGRSASEGAVRIWQAMLRDIARGVR
jgi:hypothetical protein